MAIVTLPYEYATRYLSLRSGLFGTKDPPIEPSRINAHDSEDENNEKYKLEARKPKVALRGNAAGLRHRQPILEPNLCSA
jgi:hypothetical protein